MCVNAGQCAGRIHQSLHEYSLPGLLLWYVDLPFALFSLLKEPRLPTMARQTLLLVSLLAIIRSIDAVTYLQRSQYCVAACTAALNHVSFDGKQPASASHSSPVPCTDKHYIQSLFYCASTYCTQQEAQSGLDYNNETCLADAGKPLPSYIVFMDAPPTGPATSITKISEKDVKTQKFTQPVVPDRDFYSVGYDSTVSTTHSLHSN